MGRRFHALHPNGRGLAGEVERCADGSREEVRADTVVGGDGAASRVARAAGWAPLETVPLMQAIVPLPKDMAPDTVRVWFVPQDTPYFYWLIPESAERGALGVIGESGPETRRRLQRFLEKRRFDPIEFQGGRIPVYTSWVPVRRQVGQSSVYLVGDAAAQVKGSTVGGTVTGFRGALGVAEAAADRLASPGEVPPHATPPGGAWKKCSRRWTGRRSDSGAMPRRSSNVRMVKTHRNERQTRRVKCLCIGCCFSVLL